MAHLVGDSTLSLLSRGYAWLPDLRRRRAGGPVRTRLVGKPTLVLTGPSAVDFFYDERHVLRESALPGPVLDTLFGRGAVHTLDGDRYRVRKDMFVSLLMSEGGVASLTDRLSAQWLPAVDGWQDHQVVLFDEIARVLADAVCDWAGMPLGPMRLVRWPTTAWPWSTASPAWAPATGARVHPTSTRGRSVRRSTRSWRTSTRTSTTACTGPVSRPSRASTRRRTGRCSGASTSCPDAWPTAATWSGTTSPSGHQTVHHDVVYDGRLKCNRSKLTEDPVLWAYARDLFRTPGFGDTVDFDHVKRHYCRVHSGVNPTGIVPVGPDPSGWLAPHNRERLGGTPSGDTGTAPDILPSTPA